MLVVAPCFYPNTEPAKLMMGSAGHHGIDVALYGMEQQFVAHGADAQVLKLHQFLQGIHDDLILVTDCRDVLFMAAATEIEERYRSFGSKLVMSTEKGYWPPNDEVLQGMPSTGFGYDHINAGQYIGERDYILYCLKHLLDNYRPHSSLDNSQGWWPLALVRGELHFSLDSTCNIFQTMSSGERLERVGSRVYNPQTGNYPSLVHFNGNRDLTAYRNLYEELYGNSQ